MAGPLAQKIRAKFPGVYDDLDDATLEARVLAKHPEYKDMVAPETPAAPSMGPTHSLGENVLRLAKQGVDYAFSKPEDAIEAVGPAAGAGLGAGIGAMFGGVGALPGAAIGATGGYLWGKMNRGVSNVATGKPVTEGMPQSAGELTRDVAVNVAGNAVPEVAIPAVVKGLTWAGKKAIGRAVGPPSGILNKMAEARGRTPQEVREYLGDVSYKNNIPPTGTGLRKAINKVNINSAEQKGMETAAGEAGQSIDMRRVMKDTRKSSLNYRKPGASIRNIEADTRPNASIAATKAALEETATQHPQLSVPFESVRTKVNPTTLVPEDTVRRSSIPNPEAAPAVVGDVRRGVNAKLVDAYGLDPESKAGIVVDKAWAHNTGKALENATADVGTRGYADIGRESHDLLNLVDALRNRSYNTATNPIRLYEFLGALSGNPEAIGLGMASRPGFMWNTGRGMRMQGEALAANQDTIGNLYRAAMLSMMGNQGK